jgi:hypothetical protein
MEQIVVRKAHGPRGHIMQQFKVHEIDGDYLICHTWDGTDEGAVDIKVARPYLLRRTPFDGYTRNSITYTYVSDVERTAAKSGETDITELVTPSYQVGDVIYAIRDIRGGTAVEDAPNWLDCNVDGRAWAESDE